MNQASLACTGIILGCSAMFACTSPITQLVVSVDSDYDVPAELDLVMVTTEHGQEGARGPHRFAMTTGDAIPFSFGVRPLDDDPTRKVRLTLSGFKEGEPAPRVVRMVDIGFVKGRQLLLPVFLDKRCGVIWDQCSGSDTCVDGQCTSAAVDERGLDEYTEGKDLLPHDRPDAGVGDGGAPDAGDGDGGVGDDAGVVDTGPCEISLGPPEAFAEVSLDIAPNAAVFAGDADQDGVPELISAELGSSARFSVIDFEGCATPVVQTAAIPGNAEDGPLLANSRLHFSSREGLLSVAYSGAGTMIPTLNIDNTPDDARGFAASLDARYIGMIQRRGGWGFVTRDTSDGNEVQFTTSERLRSSVAHFANQDFIAADEEHMFLFRGDGSALEIGEDADDPDDPIVIDGALISQPNFAYVALTSSAHLMTYRVDKARPGEGTNTSSVSTGGVVSEPVALVRGGEVKIAFLSQAGEVRWCALQSNGNCTLSNERFSIAGELPTSGGLITGYVDNDDWPDLILVTAQGTVHFLSGAAIETPAAPSIMLGRATVGTAALAPDFWSSFSEDGSLLAVQHSDRLSLIKWRKPASAGSTRALWSQRRRDATKSAHVPD